MENFDSLIDYSIQKILYLADINNFEFLDKPNERGPLYVGGTGTDEITVFADYKNSVFSVWTPKRTLINLQLTHPEKSDFDVFQKYVSFEIKFSFFAISSYGKPPAIDHYLDGAELEYYKKWFDPIAEGHLTNLMKNS